jgi:hypothetical protein
MEPFNHTICPHHGYLGQDRCDYQDIAIDIMVVVFEEGKNQPSGWREDGVSLLVMQNLVSLVWRYPPQNHECSKGVLGDRPCFAAVSLQAGVTTYVAFVLGGVLRALCLDLQGENFMFSLYLFYLASTSSRVTC